MHLKVTFVNCSVYLASVTSDLLFTAVQSGLWVRDWQCRLFVTLLSDSAASAHVLQRSRWQLKALCLSVRLCMSPKRDSKAALCRLQLRIIINTHTQRLCVYWHCSAEAVNCVGCRLLSHCQRVSAVGLMASIFTA